MRSPWILGAAALVWLLICGWLGSSVANVLSLWVVGLSLAVLVRRGREAAPTGIASGTATPTLTSSETHDDADAHMGTRAVSMPIDEFATLPPNDIHGLGAEGGEEDDGEVAWEEHADDTAGDGDMADSSDAGPDADVPMGGDSLVVMSASEVAHVFGADVTVVQEAMRSGELPGNALDGEWMCNRQSLIRWLDGRWT